VSNQNFSSRKELGLVKKHFDRINTQSIRQRISGGGTDLWKNRNELPKGP